MIAKEQWGEFRVPPYVRYVLTWYISMDAVVLFIDMYLDVYMYSGTIWPLLEQKDTYGPRIF